MDRKKLSDMEKGFWLDGPAFYERSMAPSACMVFPAPVGILVGTEIIEALRHAPRWDSVDFDNESLAKLGNTIVFAYESIGRRDGEEPYTAFCASTYVHQQDKWLLLAHQQTPKV